MRLDHARKRGLVYQRVDIGRLDGFLARILVLRLRLIKLLLILFEHAQRIRKLRCSASELTCSAQATRFSNG